MPEMTAQEKWEWIQMKIEKMEKEIETLRKQLYNKQSVGGHASFKAYKPE